MSAKKTPEQLARHITATYRALRMGLSWLALAFAPLLVIIGYVFHDKETLRRSMSAYYHFSYAQPVFVGILFAVGVILYLYKGYSDEENIALNIAGVMAIGIALFPTGTSVGMIHGACAVAFFACIAYVCRRCANDTLDLLPDQSKRGYYERWYEWHGKLMIISPAIAVALSWTTGLMRSFTFFAELVAIIVFAMFWRLKSRELKESDADKRATRRELELIEVFPAGAGSKPMLPEKTVVPAASGQLVL